MDIVQSVHRSLLVGLRDQKFDIRSPDKLVALASLMVRRKVARKWRMHRRELQRTISGAESDDLAEILSALASPVADPASVAAWNDQLAHFCGNLTPLERQMLQLRLDGNTSTEVAQELGMHPVAIRVRWTRLRQRLHDAGILLDGI
jgi:RNA polymerase sigma-70 factor (ECF subfamily)